MKSTEPIYRPTFSVAAELIEYAAHLYGIEPWDMARLGRQRRRFQPRFAVIWAMRQMAPGYSTHGNPYSYHRIAKMLGYEDHTSVIYGEREAAKMREADPKFRELTDKLMEFIRTRHPQVRIAA